MQHRTTSAHRAPAGGTDPETAPLTVTPATASAPRPARRAAVAARQAPAALRRRPGVYLGVAAAGAVLVNLVMGVDPAAQAEAEVEVAESVSVAQALGLTAQSSPAAAGADLQPLSDLVVSRSDRDAEEVAAQQAQAAADQAVLDQQRAAAEAAAAAAAQAEAEAAAAAQAAAAAAAAAEAEAEAEAAEESTAAAPAPTAGGTAVSAVARISNTAGSVSSRVQAAANAVVSNVPGAGSITLGGTRPSAADPAGHPSGNALDYMVLSNTSLGNAIVQYHIAHWNELGVDYLIYQQRILQSPGGSWSSMADRGSATANHYDHVHVNYN